MKDDNKTRKQLENELSELRSQNADLKKSVTGSVSAELAAEEALRYAESIVETIREPLLVLDAELKIISANRNFYSTFKAIPGETIGSFIYDLGNKQWDIPKLRELLEEVLPEKQAFDNFEVDHNFQDIGHKIMLLNACRIYRKDIGATMILLAIEDITERKRLEDLLTESEERFRRLFETASDGIVLLEKGEGKITHANPATEKMLGYTKKDSIGHSLEDIGVLLDRGDFQTTLQNLNKIGILNYDDIPIETKSGQHIDTEIYLVDRARLVQCNIRDITERKRAEEALRESEELFRSYLELAPDGVYLIDLEGKFLYGNLKCEAIIGYQREELIGKSFLELNILPEKSINKAAQLLQANIEGKSTGPDEIELISKEGRIIPVEISASVVQRMGQPIVLGFVRDITNRKRTEEALRESEEKYRWVLDNMADVITVMDMNLRFTYVSPSIMRMRGYTAEEAVAQTLEQVMTPESLLISAKVFEEEMKLEAGGTADPDRIRIVVVEQYRKDGSIVLMENHLSFMRDEAKKAVGIISVSHDITRRRRAEENLQNTLESLRRAVNTTIQVMVAAVEVRDSYTSGHQTRSADLARAIATEMGLSEEKIEGTRMAGSIHDIGKLSIPAEILSKPTKLHEIEFSLIKEHARTGYEMLKDVESPWPLAEIVYQHHERMDGSGYPRKLKGEEILMEARILMVADVVEAMASHRPYRPGLGIDAALNEIEKNRGIFYDEAVADACLRLFREKGYQLLS